MKTMFTIADFITEFNSAKCPCRALARWARAAGREVSFHWQRLRGGQAFCVLCVDEREGKLGFCESAECLTFSKCSMSPYLYQPFTKLLQTPVPSEMIV